MFGAPARMQADTHACRGKRTLTDLRTNMFAPPCCRKMSENLSRLVVAWGNRCAEEWECIHSGSSRHLRICRFYRSTRLTGAAAAGEGIRGSGGRGLPFASEMAQHMEPVLVATAIAAESGVAVLQAAVEGGDPLPGTFVAMGNLFTALLMQARPAILGAALQCRFNYRTSGQ